MVNSKKLKILVGVSASIAAYKALELIRGLQKNGHTVRSILTPAATKFVTPLSFQAITGFPVNVSLWEESSEANGMSHIGLGDWADLIVVAPATADTIAKIDLGLADSSLLAMILAAKAKIIVCPAMNVNMYENVATQKHINSLKEKGVTIIDSEFGELACGWIGKGRLADINEIVKKIESLEVKETINQDLKDKKILISCGGTKEYIDPVRFLTNRSSGKMGIALANEAVKRGAKVYLVYGSINTALPQALEYSKYISSAEEMKTEIFKLCKSKSTAPDVILMSAAVADFKIKNFSKEKIKKGDLKQQKKLSIELVENPDILKELGEWNREKKKSFIVGFAVETVENHEAFKKELKRKLKDKAVDMIVGNQASTAFDSDSNEVWITTKNSIKHIGLDKKEIIAKKIIDSIV